MLHEEQEHSMKIDAMRKALEEQVKQLQVQIQEAEAAALLGGKRVIAKLETRVTRAFPPMRTLFSHRVDPRSRDRSRRGDATTQGDTGGASQEGSSHQGSADAGNIVTNSSQHITTTRAQVDEEHKNAVMAQDTADRLNEKLNIYKRQLGEAVSVLLKAHYITRTHLQETMTMNNLTRVRRYQRELEDAEGECFF